MIVHLRYVFRTSLINFSDFYDFVKLKTFFKFCFVMVLFSIITNQMITRLLQNLVPFKCAFDFCVIVLTAMLIFTTGVDKRDKKVKRRQ